MSVVLAIEEIGPCRKQLKIEVPQPAVEAEAARVTAEVARKAKLPGFRKGKVPVSIVRRQFGDEIRRELLERILPRYWRQAAAEKALEPLGMPKVGDIHLHDGEPMTFTAVIEVRPEFELRNYKDFALPTVEVEPTPAEVGSPRIWDELNLAVTGLAPGGSAKFARKEGEGEESRERSFEAKLVEVKAAKLPALDDSFFGHFGKFDGREAFEADIAKRIKASKVENARSERERALLDQLTERHPMPLPEGVVHQEVEDLLREYAEGLVRRGVDLEKEQIDWQKVGEEAKPHAERRVKARLLLDAVAEKESIAVGEEEFEQALAVLARVQGVASGALRQRLDSSGELAGLRARMRREKAVRYLLGEENF